MSKTNKAKFSPDDFFSRQKANDGIKLPLYLPDGSKTDEFLLVRGIDSDEFRQAESRANMDLLMLMQKDRNEKDASKKSEVATARNENKTRMISSLVADWSFEAECSEENVMQLLREAPHIADEVDRVAGDRKRFFSLPSVTSTNTPEPSST